MWTIIVCVVLIYFLFKKKKSGTGFYPPGPAQLPFIGHLLAVWFKLRKLKHHHKVWQAWSRTYGEVLGLKLGLLNVVVVSGKDMIREVSSREEFEGRPNGFFYLLRSFGKKLGIVFSDGPYWTSTKRIVLKHLRSFGFGTGGMEKIILLECDALIRMRLGDAGTPVLVNTMFDVTIINVLWKLVAGKRYDLNEEHAKKICALIRRSFSVVDMSGGVINFLPFLRHVFPGLTGYRELTAMHNTIHHFIRETIEEHLVDLDPKNPRDAMDSLLLEFMEEKDNSTESEEELQVIFRDLLEAGMETVSNTAVFMLLHLVRNPEVQKRVWTEIKMVVGDSRIPKLSDRNRMAYTEAVLMETLRISSVAAVGIPHMALEDARLQNYIIPKGTFLLLSMHDLHNGEHWSNPEDFKPERFLTKDGNLIQDEWLMPFGAGRRRCIGEGLARSELFLLLSHIVQRFHLTLPTGDPIPSTEPVNGVSLSAKPFRIVFEPRF